MKAECVETKCWWIRVSLARAIRLLAALAFLSVLLVSWGASLRRRDETRMRLAWQGGHTRRKRLAMYHLLLPCLESSFSCSW